MEKTDSEESIVYYTEVLITAIKGFIVEALAGQVLNSNLDFLFFKKHFWEKIFSTNWKFKVFNFVFDKCCFYTVEKFALS